MGDLDLSFLPAVNATLNGLATVMLVVGWVLIRRDRQRFATAHRAVMSAAFLVSCLFLVSYVTHYTWRASATGDTHTSPGLEGPAKTAYRLFLLLHILFATAVPFLALRQFWLAFKGRMDAHRFWGRITMPVWLYTGVTGVLIYFVLYHWFPPAA